MKILPSAAPITFDIAIEEESIAVAEFKCSLSVRSTSEDAVEVSKSGAIE